MQRVLPLLIAAPLVLAASAPVAPAGPTLDDELRRARAEQAAAEAEARKLQAAAQKANGDAARLRAEQIAAAQAIEAAEARLTASDAQLRLISATIAARRARLEQEQQPVSSLLAGLTMMARRPPLLALANDGNTDEFVKVRVLLDATLPVIRARTSALSAELAEGQRLEQNAALARQELIRSKEEMASRREQFAALEEKALAAAASAGGRALGAGDVALVQGENLEQLRSEQSDSRSAAALASQLAALDPVPPRPTGSQGPVPPAPFVYVLPASAPVTEGLGAVSDSGVKARGLTLATPRGAAIIVPADGIVRFSGPYRNHDGVVIIDHGNGWMSLIVNLASEVKRGDRVRLGQSLGRALGPLSVELSQNGRRMSPALIAGSSPPLSNTHEGG